MFLELLFQNGNIRRIYRIIDSLKEISRYFSVSIDDLLSGDQLIFIAEKENKSNLNSLCDLLLGIVDLLSLMLIFLPLYSSQLIVIFTR